MIYGVYQMEQMMKQPTLKETLKKPGRDLQAFRESHDKNFIVPKKIEAAITKLGPESWEYEVDFLKLAGLCTRDLAMFRDGFEDFTVLVTNKNNSKRLWCGSKTLAAKLRAMV